MTPQLIRLGLIPGWKTYSRLKDILEYHDEGLLPHNGFGFVVSVLESFFSFVFHTLRTGYIIFTTDRKLSMFLKLKKMR